MHSFLIDREKLALLEPFCKIDHTFGAQRLPVDDGRLRVAWRCKLVEFGGEADHVHLLIDIHPALDISVLVNNLKTASARRSRNRFADHLAKFYWKPLFWHGAYFVGSVGGATLETVRAYVESQGTQEHARKKGKAL